MPLQNIIDDNVTIDRVEQLLTADNYVLVSFIFGAKNQLLKLVLSQHTRPRTVSLYSREQDDPKVKD